MKYYSLNRNSPLVNFREATIRGLAPDKGLYFPTHIPLFGSDMLREIKQGTNEDIAYNAILPYVGDVIPSERLMEIVTETINFPIPLIPLDSFTWSLEMYHGPTLAFKDIGARFMSRCLGYFAQQEKRKLTVLVATSGDTGGAVADGFYGVDGVDVVILYPSGKVSNVQEKQVTSLGENIHALEIKGDFDDCQRIVKDIFNSKEVNDKLFLTSANSINIARWLPQQFYYLFAWKKLGSNVKPVISVPSGNFGNLCAAMVAHISGMPVKKFIAACNSNDTIPRYLQTGKYHPNKTTSTISNAMDVANPSNFVRIEELYHHDLSRLKDMLIAVKVTEEETAGAINRALLQNNYLLDPHGAVAFCALRKYQETDPESLGYLVETAHPVKFFNTVESITGRKVEIPDQVALQLQKKKKSLVLEPVVEQVIDFLFSL